MQALAQQIAAFIRDERAGSFDQLAQSLFAYQFAHNAPYRRLVESLGESPASVKSYRDIPTVPAEGFKRFDLTCRPVDQCPVVFHSSGTTAAQASRHYMDRQAVALYELSLAEGYRRAIDGPAEIWALMPAPAEAPHSSLTHMLSTLRAKRWFWSDPAELALAIPSLAASPPARIGGTIPEGQEGGHDKEEGCRGRERPIALFGTAFYFAGYFERIDEPTPLPAGSIVIETGGYKGRTRELPREELYGLFQDRFGVPAKRCYGEYGMCEMGSQFYSNGHDGAFAGPHWVRTRAIDPITGEDAAPGEPGLLRHYDLANINSVLAIQTQDMGLVHADGRFTLLGRAPSAEVRGCSLTAEDLWTSRR